MAKSNEAEGIISQEIIGTRRHQWLNICIGCGRHKTTHGPELPSECPECHGTRWLCHLLSQNEPEAAQENKISRGKPADPIKTGNGILSQGSTFNKMTKTSELSEMESARVQENLTRPRRGRKPRAVPGDLIKELSDQGYSSRQIAEELDRRGFQMSYRSIQRYLVKQNQCCLI